ncbi:MAG: cysteine desulfurase family protein [Actinomycetes bacterium]
MRSYLDHASNSPMRASAIEAMTEWYAGMGGDPSRIYAEGMQSRVELEVAREQVAELLGARPREVVFTSGATESIAAASFGAVQRAVSRTGSPNSHVVYSAVEHSAVREWARRNEHTEVGVDPVGRVDPAELLGAITANTSLVHLQWGNHEVGTLQPISEVAEGCGDLDLLLHVDAAQAVGRVKLNFANLGADLMSVSAHKFGGPPGVGALLIRKGLRIEPLLVGGEQERARRGGMENLPAVLGFAAAAQECGQALDQESELNRAQTERIIQWAAEFSGVEVLGDPVDRLPHIVCLGLEGLEPQPVLLGLDQAGIAVHSGNSCSSESLEPSPILQAMGVDAAHSLRISVGWNTLSSDIDHLLVTLAQVIADLRQLR